MNGRGRLGTAVALTAALLAAAQTPSLAADPTVTKRATLPDITLSSIQPSIGNDRTLKLGGIGSGLFPIGNDEYWTVTDRGPNADAGDAKTFLLPRYTPHLVRIAVHDKTLVVQQAIPIVTPAGAPTTGLPPFAYSNDPPPLLSDGHRRASFNGSGIDPEGVVRTPNGAFWVVEEYGPSILHIDATGHVLHRFVPAGTPQRYAKAHTGYPVIGSLPADLAKRRTNRGFEDIALMPDGHSVVVALQSSPNKASPVTELIGFDTLTGRTLGTVDYRFDNASSFADAKTKDLKISALIPIDRTHVVVEERTDSETRFYAANVNQPDHLISGSDKTLLVNLAGIQGVPQKIEGAALKDPHTLVVISDNDFGFVDSTYPLGADVRPSGEQTVLAEIKLPD